MAICDYRVFRGTVLDHPIKQLLRVRQLRSSGIGRHFRLPRLLLRDNLLPFEDEVLLKLHHRKHRNEFDPMFATEAEYEAAADTFMQGPVVAPVRERVRKNGERVRFNRRTREL